MLTLLFMGATFYDATAEVGLSGLSSTVAVWGDFNSDGYPDLYAYNQLWENTGGSFVPALSSPVGFGQWGDFNNDGEQEMATFYGTPILSTQDLATGMWTGRPGAFPTSGIVDSRGISLGDFNSDGFLDVYFGAYESNGYEIDELYVGDGTLDFFRAWTEGVLTSSSTPYPHYSRPGRGVTSCDFDEDGDLDIYVSNYRLEANYLLLNDGTGGFYEAAAIFGADGIDDGWSYGFGHTIGSAWGDLDNDGHFDLFVGNFSHPLFYQDTPRFLRNTGPSGGYFFEDLSDTAQLAWQESYASPTLGDYDNDGDLDLFFTTVYSGDYPVLYRNDGNWQFTDVTAEAGLAYIGATYQAGWADIDLDGDLDLATGGVLYKNQGNDHSWLLIRLVGNGETDNRDAIGAQVRITVGKQVMARQVEAGTGETNNNAPTLHFGLGQHEDPVTLQIRWPSGVTETVEDVDLNQLIEITQCIDRDGDGFEDAACGGLDCDDSTATTHPDAEEVYYDGIDSNCDEWSDFDADGDGVDASDHGGTDCDDTDSSVGTTGVETWYDGLDEDCDGWSDFDADGDGFDAAEHGGEDCDDSNPTIHPDAEEVYYDGIDSDCDGWSDFDADGDGQDAAEHGGRDCDDTDSTIYSGAPDPEGDGIDQNCDGITPPDQHPQEGDAAYQGGGCAHVPAGGWLLGLVLVGLRRRR